jgi:hypothetical protein
MLPVGWERGGAGWRLRLGGYVSVSVSAYDDVNVHAHVNVNVHVGSSPAGKSARDVAYRPSCR